MKSTHLIKKAYQKYNQFCCENTYIKRLIYIQHRILPMPISLYARLYNFKLFRLLFGFYGQHVWIYCYRQKDKVDSLNWWLCKESLYWHFYYQLSFDRHIEEILKIPEINEIMQNSELTAIEIGFGIGKNYRYWFKNNRLKKYIAVEPNIYMGEYVKRKFHENNFCLLTKSVEELLYSDVTFDILIATGGVFMFLSPEITDAFLKSLPERGCQVVIIVREGTWKNDIYRPDNSIMYNFKIRLQRVGFVNKKFVEERGPNDIYRYFMMY